MRTTEEASQTQKAASKNKQNRAIKSITGSIVIIEPNQTENDFRVISERVSNVYEGDLNFSKKN